MVYMYSSPGKCARSYSGQGFVKLVCDGSDVRMSWYMDELCSRPAAAVLDLLYT